MRYTATSDGGKKLRLSPLMMLQKSGQERPYPPGNPQMLPADQWPDILANVQGTMVRGTERASCRRLLDLLNVEANPAVRQRVAKRKPFFPVRAGATPELGFSARKLQRKGPTEAGRKGEGYIGCWRKEGPSAVGQFTA
jgi:hypothetical protein